MVPAGTCVLDTTVLTSSVPYHVFVHSLVLLFILLRFLPILYHTNKWIPWYAIVVFVHTDQGVAAQHFRCRSMILVVLVRTDQLDVVQPDHILCCKNVDSPSRSTLILMINNNDWAPGLRAHHDQYDPIMCICKDHRLVSELNPFLGLWCTSVLGLNSWVKVHGIGMLG